MTDNKSIFFREPFAIIKQLVRWTLYIIPIALVIGSLVALFLWLLTTAVHFRFEHKWILFLLPLAGLLIHFIYQSIGKSSEKGNNLIFEEIHREGGDVPTLMTPIILITTVITHLFGGSAGREGTAVQIGGSIAAMFGRWFKLKGIDMRMILTAGVAAGFGAVFGTPVTGAIFAMEVLTIGRIKYDALIPALIGSVVGDMTVGAWHVSHMHYQIDVLPDSSYLFSNFIRPDIALMGKVVIAAAVFGLASFLFAGMISEIKIRSVKLFRFKWMIPVCGGLVIIGLTTLLGKPDYLSLGVDAEYPGAVTLTSAFHTGGSDTWSWLWKTIYTTITLGTGFKGGEVTPLFYIGATLGNTLSGILHAPVGLFAALGFIAVFAGATNTPLACTIMGVELFGGQHVLLFAIACFTAYICSGHSGIYTAQRNAVPEVFDAQLDNELSVTEAMKSRGYMHQKLAKYRLFDKRNKRKNNDSVI